MEELKKELIVEAMHSIYTIGGLVNAWSSSVSPKVAGALIVPAIFVLRGDILSVFVGFWF